jgi:hypothetical protein
LNRARAAAVALFVLVVVVLWVRHQRAREAKNRRFAEVLATANAQDARRIDGIREAAKKPSPSEPRACPVKTRVRIVRLAGLDARGGSLNDVAAAIAEEREPKPWSHELDVVDGRAFLYDYDAGRVVCVGSDADDPHGTLIAY